MDIMSPVADSYSPALGGPGLPFCTDTNQGRLPTSLAFAQSPHVLEFCFLVFFSGKKSPLSKKSDFLLFCRNLSTSEYFQLLCTGQNPMLWRTL